MRKSLVISAVLLGAASLLFLSQRAARNRFDQHGSRVGAVALPQRYRPDILVVDAEIGC